ncbi:MULTISPECIES: BTAD domain-containing putative transcriptional regulator [unclassified Streptomyces]|uniref:AfsR/SARP family transcriptional regulator n=1 Tax=unclassified Streptomyces TaxID=2593676 RepID=UPI000CD5A937|nr:BTAD domain-containing putative transcriptional regulator [Streptomyces sp. SM10]
MTEFLVLGSLEMRRSGEVVPVRGMRQQKLLALLLIGAGRVVPVDFLVDELWDTPPSSARTQVHNAVHDLRRILPVGGGSSLVTADIGYRLTVPGGALDMHLFTCRVRAAKAAEREGRLTESVRLLQSAVDLWRGDAFVGIKCSAVLGAAVKLDEQRLTAIEDLMALRLRAGEGSSLVGELHALIARYPLRDALRGSLMTALCRSGRQADALAVYDEGRRHLAEELGLEPGSGLRALHAEILADSPAVHGAVRHDTTGREGEMPAPPAGAPAASGPAGRNFLPRDLPDFTGRTTDLRRLLDAVGRGGAGAPRVVAVDGTAGVGKTVLAVHAGHRLAPDHPDGQYAVELHGFSPLRGPVTPEEALGTLLQADGIAADALPVGLAPRSALWRSRLAGRRSLLILDDALDTGQIRPLLPGTGGVTVLVTSRRRLTALDGSVPLSLDVMPQEDAVTLFGRITGEERAAREPDQVARAVELCGHLPLAVRMAATRLRDRPAMRAGDLVTRLTGTTSRMRCLRTAERDLMPLLRVSYLRLSPAERRYSRLLSLHPAASFDLDRAAAVTGLGPDDAEQLVDVLLDNNLIRQDAAARFSFHALVRDCTRELPVEEEARGQRPVTDNASGASAGTRPSAAARVSRPRIAA